MEFKFNTCPSLKGDKMARLNNWWLFCI